MTEPLQLGLGRGAGFVAGAGSATVQRMLRKMRRHPEELARLNALAQPPAFYTQEEQPMLTEGGDN